MDKELEQTTQETITVEIEAVEEQVAEKEYPTKVEVIDETNFLIEGHPYRLIKNYRDGFQIEKIAERYSSILDRYDYVVGDWGYDQLRLRGFFSDQNRKVPSDQRISSLEDYLYEFCNFGCAYFVIERIGGGKRERRKNNHRTKNYRPRQAAYISEKKYEVDKKKQPSFKRRETDRSERRTPKPMNRVANTESVQSPHEEKRHFTIRKQENKNRKE